VIGGGVTGLMSAYLLKNSGLKVCLLEKDHVTSGDTGSTTAHLTAVTDTRLLKLVRSFGEQNAQLIWDAGILAINSLESIARQHHIQCQFRRVSGYLHLPCFDSVNKDAIDSLEREA